MTEHAPAANDQADSAVGEARDARERLHALYAQSLGVVRGEGLLTEHSTFDGKVWSYRSDKASFDFEIPETGRLIVVGAGKATASLAKGVEAVLGDRIDDGLVVVKYDHTEQLDRIREAEAAHPIPDANGVAATRQLVALLDGLTPQDRVIVLLSGGASSLLVAPADGITLEAKSATTDVLISSGASINEINLVRKALSQIKGGQLLSRIAPANSITLLISDVPGGDVGAIGSGPTVPEAPDAAALAEIRRRYNLDAKLPDSVLARLDEAVHADEPNTTGDHQVFVLAESADMVRELCSAAEARGLGCVLGNVDMEGQTHAEAEAFVDTVRAVTADQRPCIVVAAGESTLEVNGKGKGGRNQEFALVVAKLLAGEEGVSVLCAGTDGTDGPTDAAGAFADGTSWARIRAAGLDPDASLADNDSYTVFEAVGDLLITGPTGTNVMDVAIALVE